MPLAPFLFMGGAIMPYSGVPEGSELEKKIERCVTDVMADDPEMDKSGAIAICRDSIENKSKGTMITQSPNGKFKVKGYEDQEFDTGPDAVTFMRNMMTQKRKEALATKGIYGPTSFAELDEARIAWEKADQMYWLVSDFMYLVDNAVYDDEADIGTSVRQLANEFADRADRIATTVDPNPLMKEQTLAEKVKGIVQSLLPKKKEPNKLELATDTSSIRFYKSGDVLKWVATYSNNLRDDDHPAEIISAESHKKHVALVKAGLVSPPNLWLWHEPEWKWGTGEWVTYDEQDNGVVFVHAGGTVDKGLEELATAICEDEDVWGVSHGMPIWSVSHDKDDPTIITEHITEEVSPLPMWAAANKFTSFSLNKEATMAIPKQEKARLMADNGVSEALLGLLEQSTQSKSARAAEQERQFKDAGASVPAATEPVVETPVETAEVVVEVEVDATPEVVDEGVVTLKEADVHAIIKSVTTLAERMNVLETQVKAQSAAIGAAVAQKAAETPTASLLSLMQKAVSPIDNPEARVDGRTNLAKSAPEETVAVHSVTGIPFIDGLLNGNGGN